MSICSCCNDALDPEWATDHMVCPLCWKSGCSALHASHPVQQEQERDEGDDE